MSRHSAFHLFDTEFGMCGLAWTALGVSRVQLPESDVAATEARMQAFASRCVTPDVPLHAASTMALLQSYLRGEPTDFSPVVLDLTGIPPQEQAIYAALRRIGTGQTTTYGHLAQAIGAPGAARVVGRAMARNPWPVIVPCHRVLTAHGTSGGFSAYGGEGTQRRLLRLEGAIIPGDPIRLPDLFE